MISLLMKNIGMRKCSQLCWTTPIAELIITFSSCIFRFFCTLVSAHCYPASMLYCRRGCSSVLVERFIVCRDESGKGNTKWQKGKINFAVPSDLHGLLPTSSDPKQRADEHTWIYIASLSSLLQPALPCQLSNTTGRHFLFFSLQEGRDEGRKKRLLPGCEGRVVLPDAPPASPQRMSCCAHPISGETFGHRQTWTIRWDTSSCVWWTNCHVTCLYLVYTATGILALIFQNPGQSGPRQRNLYIYVHTFLKMRKVDAILLWVPE